MKTKREILQMSASLVDEQKLNGPYDGDANELIEIKLEMLRRVLSEGVEK